MIRITYRESSIECDTKEEMTEVLRVLNDIKRENAKAGLTVRVRVDDLLKREQQAPAPRFKPKPN